MSRRRSSARAPGAFRLGLAALLLALAACTPGDAATRSPATQAPPGTTPAPSSVGPASELELQVYAAASLRDALAALEAAYQAANPGIRFSSSADSSTALAAKIEQGAPADVFLAADMANPRRLAEGGLASGDVVAFAGNHLIVVVPADNPAAIDSPADLARPGVRIVACAQGVPVERYTAQLLDRLVTVSGYPAGFPDAYRANIVSAEDNVGAIVTKVGLGEGDAGIVYVTDARATDAVATIEIPAEANVPATYGGVVVGTSDAPEAAAAFLAWVAGPDGQAILSSFGFRPVR